MIKRDARRRKYNGDVALLNQYEKKIMGVWTQPLLVLLACTWGKPYDVYTISWFQPAGDKHNSIGYANLWGGLILLQVLSKWTSCVYSRQAPHSRYLVKKKIRTFSCVALGKHICCSMQTEKEIRWCANNCMVHRQQPSSYAWLSKIISCASFLLDKSSAVYGEHQAFSSLANTDCTVDGQ